MVLSIVVAILIIQYEPCRYENVAIVKYCDGKEGLVRFVSNEGDEIHIRNYNVAVPQLNSGNSVIDYNVCGYTITESVNK